MRDGLADRQTLDALGSPLRRDLAAGNAPDFLGVILEERTVEARAEPIYEEILERYLLAARKRPRARVAHTHTAHVPETEVGHGRQVHLEWIVEELAAVVDARQAR